jgi:hypothetical protein
MFRFAQHDNGIYKFGSQTSFVVATVILTSDALNEHARC